MRELLGRVTALDSEAGAAMRVIAYFDELLEQRAGLHSVVRGAAFLAGCPARLVDDGRRLRLRIGADGVRLEWQHRSDPGWPAHQVDAEARLILERAGEPTVLDAMILERAAATARSVLDRTRARPTRADPALVEILLDPLPHPRTAAAPPPAWPCPPRPARSRCTTARP
ncbi:hypothetical protein OIE66_28675 [Nonomuraea sp. NBC_01738]|uniref:hypothetical protein n=1 Tax=Nonomuraea sp. NBC_01738 TaxID=2976003 RepID=UPI002E13DEB1|nr:hypothetical protein OIE66_28675 [Nonomuraea sp. NBC_01738]